MPRSGGHSPPNSLPRVPLAPPPPPPPPPSIQQPTPSPAAATSGGDSGSSFRHPSTSPNGASAAAPAAASFASAGSFSPLSLRTPFLAAMAAVNGSNGRRGGGGGVGVEGSVERGGSSSATNSSSIRDTAPPPSNSFVADNASHAHHHLLHIHRPSSASSNVNGGGARARTAATATSALPSTAVRRFTATSTHQTRLSFVDSFAFPLGSLHGNSRFSSAAAAAAAAASPSPLVPPQVPDNFTVVPVVTPDVLSQTHQQAFFVHNSATRGRRDANFLLASPPETPHHLLQEPKQNEQPRDDERARQLFGASPMFLPSSGTWPVSDGNASCRSKSASPVAPAEFAGPVPPHNERERAIAAAMQSVATCGCVAVEELAAARKAWTTVLLQTPPAPPPSSTSPGCHDADDQFAASGSLTLVDQHEPAMPAIAPTGEAPSHRLLCHLTVPADAAATTASHDAVLTLDVSFPPSFPHVPPTPQPRILPAFHFVSFCADDRQSGACGGKAKRASASSVMSASAIFSASSRSFAERPAQQQQQHNLLSDVACRAVAAFVEYKEHSLQQQERRRHRLRHAQRARGNNNGDDDDDDETGTAAPIQLGEIVDEMIAFVRASIVKFVRAGAAARENRQRQRDKSTQALPGQPQHQQQEQAPDKQQPRGGASTFCVVVG